MKVNPSYVEALKRVVKNSPYPSHMAMALDHIEIDGADVGLNLAQCHLQP